MCLAIPARVVELLPNEQAIVDLGGIRKSISIALVSDVAVGDYVIVHVGHAIGSIDPEEAERTLALFGEMAQMAAQDTAQDQTAQALASASTAASTPASAPAHLPLETP
jgi:hydrogenase expression/formation protein HypC